MEKKGNRVSEGTVTLGKFCVLLAISISFVFPIPLFPRSAVYPSKLSDLALVSASTREGRLAIFDDAWSTINERYYDRGFHGLDWDAQRTTFRSLAAEANTSQELYAVLREMIAALNDPHTRVFAPEEKFDWWRPRVVTIGLAVREVGGLPVVVKVEPDSAPHRAGLRAGDMIETVNGDPALSRVSSRLPSGAASASSRSRAFAKLLDGPPKTSVEIRWKRKDGKEKLARFERHSEQRELGMRIRKEMGDIAIIEIDAFTRSIASDFTRGLKERLNGVRGLILDLRGNGGGDAEAMADVASAFLGDGFGLGQFTDRAGSSFAISTRSKSPFIAERITQTKAPLIVLAGERTSSAAEIFIAALKTAHRALIIGTETCGCVVAIRTRHNLPDGGVLDVSELDYKTPAGARLERNGIKPDEIVTVERSDLYAGRDRAMEIAIRKLTMLRIGHH
jgi:carboxyl-terminal processing protease